MTFWILHVSAALVLGILFSLFMYFIKQDIFWGLCMLFGLLLAQFIDLDHYEKDTKQLLKGATALSEKDYANIYDRPVHRYLHNWFTLFFITFTGQGFIFGLWLHCLMDGGF